MGMFSWVAIALVLVIVELLTGTFFCLVLAVSVLCGALCSVFIGGTPSVIIAAVIAVAGCVLISMRRRASADDAAHRLQNADVGHTVRVWKWEGRFARVSYRGAMWDARTSDPDPQPGDWVVAALDGNCLILAKPEGE